jgi:site-specific DNA-methyltransferase (adenine-specific)
MIKIGQAELHNIDCMAYMATLPDNAFDLAIVDPPYGIERGGQTETFTKNPKHKRKLHKQKEWDNEIPTSEYFNELVRVSKNQIIWGGNYFTEYLKPTKAWIFWYKGQRDLTMSDGELAWTTEDKPLRCITVNRAALQGSVHPTQMPVKVIDFCIDYAGSPNLIIDAYCGSGSTMVAAHQLKRKCYGMELDPKYCDVIVKRIIKLDPTLNIKRNGVVIDKKEFE